MSAYFQSGGLVDAVLNLGLPAPIDVQVSGSSLHASYRVAAEPGAGRSARFRGPATFSFRRTWTTPPSSSMWTACAPANWG